MTFTEQLAENLLELARVKVENARLKAEIKELKGIIDDMLKVQKHQVGENSRLRNAIKDFGNADEGFDWAVLVRIEKLEHALRRIIGTIKLTVGMNPDYASTQKECKVEAEEALR